MRTSAPILAMAIELKHQPSCTLIAVVIHFRQHSNLEDYAMAMSDVQLEILKQVQERPACKVFELKLDTLGVTVKMRGLSSAEYLRITKESTRDGKYNPLEFRVRALAECLVDPDLSDTEFLGHLGVATPQDAVLKVFSNPGDLEELASHLDDVCGIREERGEFRQVQ